MITKQTQKQNIVSNQRTNSNVFPKKQNTTFQNQRNMSTTMVHTQQLNQNINQNNIQRINENQNKNLISSENKDMLIKLMQLLVTG